MLTMQGGDSLVGGLPIIHITYQQYIANPSAYQDPDVIVHISGFPTAGNMPADYVGYDSNLNMEDIGNIATKAIAKVEPSDTALYLHNVGDGFINKDGNYCITDVQISIGGTITLGTNCHVVDGGISSNLSNTPKYIGTATSIELSKPQGSTTPINFTATTNCWIKYDLRSSSANIAALLILDGASVACVASGVNQVNRVMGMLPVKAGQTITCNNDTSVGVYITVFDELI